MNKPINIKQCIEFTSNNFTRSFYIVFYCFIRFSSLLIPKQWFNNKIDIYSLIISFKLLQKVILNHIINNILMVYIIGLALGHVVYEKHIMIKIISHKYQATYHLSDIISWSNKWLHEGMLYYLWPQFLFINSFVA